MKPVRQRRKWECGIAVAAMLTGARYTLIRARCLRYWRWRQERQKDRGMPHSLFIHLIARFSRISRYADFKPEERHRLRRGVAAQVVLPSIASQRRREPAWHAVVWDGRRIIDPSTRRRYRSRWQVERQACWVTELHGRNPRPAPKSKLTKMLAWLRRLVRLA